MKCVLLSEGGDDELSRWVAGLSQVRRALSVSLARERPALLPSFVELWGREAVLRRLASQWPFAARAWLVSEHVPVAYERSWASGQPSPGVRMVSSLYRRPGTSHRAFVEHWLGPHTEVARGYTVPFWHYSQNVVTHALTEHDGEDGFVGMHFRSPEALAARWRDHPDEAARGAADAACFLDVPRSKILHAVETVWDPT